MEMTEKIIHFYLILNNIHLQIRPYFQLNTKTPQKYI